MAKEKLFYVGVKGFIEDTKGNILLLKADITHNHTSVAEAYWDIPGGRIEEGEVPLDTLAREIKEEIGIAELETVDFYTAVMSNHEIPLDDGRKAGLVLLVYKVRIPANAEITLSPEHTEYEWVEKSEAAELLANKYPEKFTSLLQ